MLSMEEIMAQMEQNGGGQAEVVEPVKQNTDQVKAGEATPNALYRIQDKLCFCRGAHTDGRIRFRKEGSSRDTLLAADIVIEIAKDVPDADMHAFAQFLMKEGVLEPNGLAAKVTDAPEEEETVTLVETVAAPVTIAAPAPSQPEVLQTVTQVAPQAPIQNVFAQPVQSAPVVQAAPAQNLSLQTTEGLKAMLPSNLQELIDAQLAQMKETATGAYPVIKLSKDITDSQGNVYRGFILPDGKAVEELKGFLLYYHDSRSMFPTGSKPGDNVPPLCASENGVNPYTGNMYSETCSGCVYNQWESDPKGGKGKACKERIRAFFWFPAISDMPAEIQFSPANLTSLRTMLDQLATHNRAYTTVKMVLTASKAPTQGMDYSLIELSIENAGIEEITKAYQLVFEHKATMTPPAPPVWTGSKDTTVISAPGTTGQAAFQPSAV